MAKKGGGASDKALGIGSKNTGKLSERKVIKRIKCLWGGGVNMEGTATPLRHKIKFFSYRMQYMYVYLGIKLCCIMRVSCKKLISIT